MEKRECSSPHKSSFSLSRTPVKKRAKENRRTERETEEKQMHMRDRPAFAHANARCTALLKIHRFTVRK